MPTWRAYDLAVYRWAVSRHTRGTEPWEAFLEGYRSVRAIPRADLDAVPVLVAARSFWLLGLAAQDVSRRGTALVEQWLVGAEQALRQWEAEL